MRRAQGRKDTKASGGAASQRLRCSQMLMALRSSAALLVWVRKIFWEGIGPVITGKSDQHSKRSTKTVDNDYFFFFTKERMFLNQYLGNSFLVEAAESRHLHN